MTGNIEKIEYYAGLDIDAKYRKVYAGTLQAWQAFLQPYYLASDVPHGDEADTWRDRQSDLSTTNPAAEIAEYIQIKLRDDGGSLFYFVNDAETLDDGFVHLTLALDEWSTYARKTGVKLKDAILLEGHGGNLVEFTDEEYYAKCIKYEQTDAARVYPSNYYDAGEIIPASDVPFAYRPIIVAELKEQVVGIFSTNNIEPIVFTNANTTPLRLDAARQFCAAWGNIEECYFKFGGGSTKKADFAIKAAYIVPEYFIDFATGQRVIGPKESEVTSYDGVIVKAGIKSKEKYYTPAPNATKKAFGTITTQITAPGIYQNISTRLKVDAVTTYYGFYMYLEAFGHRVEVTQDFAATLFTSEANARTAAQKTSEALQTVGQMSSALAAIATGAATAQPAALIGGAVSLGSAAVNIARGQKSAPVVQNQGSVEKTLAPYENEPANVYKSGFAIWNTPAENGRYLDAMTAEFGYNYPGGVYFPEVSSIFRGQTTGAKTFVKFGGDFYIIGMPANDAAIIENALKNGVKIEKL
ncbi:MAG: hypothetical protein MJ072_00010 [Clostridia bacterium]|nr:hypothetical protein [Clostridia bacterium]